MTRRLLFDQLCAVATALEAEAQRPPFTAQTCVLLLLVAELDRCIDDIVDAKDVHTWGWCDDEP